jgi:hypothetical protein
MAVTMTISRGRQIVFAHKVFVLSSVFAWKLREAAARVVLRIIKERTSSNLTFDL